MPQAVSSAAVAESVSLHDLPVCVYVCVYLLSMHFFCFSVSLCLPHITAVYVCVYLCVCVRTAVVCHTSLRKTRWALASTHTERERGMDGWERKCESGKIRNGSEKKKEEYF